ncbi:conserved hypothetical protein [Trichinella spiralis]|uniref:hypothetical protein n=1 Tax=Trichinella spiralis TaxID=6334 RepID=UPI0001EFB5DB|nr:conserved hypothetical protein [Trichinella spiralis]
MFYQLNILHLFDFQATHRVKRGSSGGGGGAFGGNCGGDVGDGTNDGTCKTGAKTARNRFLTNDVKTATSTLNSCSAAAYGGKTPASDTLSVSCKQNDNNNNNNSKAGLTKSVPTTPSSSSSSYSYSSSSPAKHNHPAAKSMKIKIGGRMTDIAELERLLDEKDKLIIQQDKDIKIHLAKIKQHEEQIKSLKLLFTINVGRNFQNSTRTNHLAAALFVKSMRDAHMQA